MRPQRITACSRSIFLAHGSTVEYPEQRICYARVLEPFLYFSLEWSFITGQPGKILTVTLPTETGSQDSQSVSVNEEPLRLFTVFSVFWVAPVKAGSCS